MNAPMPREISNALPPTLVAPRRPLLSRGGWATMTAVVYVLFLLIPAMGVERSLVAIVVIYGLVAVLVARRIDRSLMIAAAIVVIAVLGFPFGAMKSRFVPRSAAEYLNAAAEDEDVRVYVSALRNVAEAHGLAAVAEAAGIPRESLYRALSPKGNPRLSTLAAILKAAKLKLTVAA